ncbi:MAG: Lrp/AsnC family transcriptional regulator [Anaerolineales bacterium]|nr:Lrp/AsnC family transcriptional regulator [Anaerolineales bacterium]
MLQESQPDLLDDLNRAILRALQANGRLSNLELARRIRLSPPATHARVKQLEAAGYVRGYVALVDRERAGFDLLCFISVSLQLHQPEQVRNFPQAVAQMSEVLECHHVTGEADYLLKVVVRHRKELEHFIMERLTPIPGVARVQTSLVLDELKSTTALPV